MDNGGAQATSVDLVAALPPLEYTSPPPGDTAACNLARFSTPRRDDVVASPLFQGLDGAGVRVAVLDTGIDATHPALVHRIDVAASKNFTSDDPEDIADQGGHGTHCAGIIAAEDRGAIMSGIAPAATLIVCKVLGDSGRGSWPWVAAGIRHAVAQGADVISMSMGDGSDHTCGEVFTDGTCDLYKALQKALAAGVVVVVAAGNAGGRSAKNEINPPGSFGGVITVASHNDAGGRSTFSSMGGELDVMAPGETFSTYARGKPYQIGFRAYRPGRDYEQLRGTSMACPLVAGLAALLVQAGRAGRNRGGLSDELSRRLWRSNFGARNNYEVREMLRYFADRPHEHSREDGYGTLGSVYSFVKSTVEEGQLTVGGAKKAA